jgi:hypothetical protein
MLSPRALAALVVVGAVAAPATAVAAGDGGLPAWVERMTGDAPPELQRMMREPEMQRMMRTPAMERMMESVPLRSMERMMRAPAMEGMMDDMMGAPGISGDDGSAPAR